MQILSHIGILVYNNPYIVRIKIRREIKKRRVPYGKEKAIQNQIACNKRFKVSYSNVFYF